MRHTIPIAFNIAKLSLIFNITKFKKNKLVVISKVFMSNYYFVSFPDKYLICHASILGQKKIHPISETENAILPKYVLTCTKYETTLK